MIIEETEEEVSEYDTDDVTDEDVFSEDEMFQFRLLNSQDPPTQIGSKIEITKIRETKKVRKAKKNNRKIMNKSKIYREQNPDKCEIYRITNSLMHREKRKNPSFRQQEQELNSEAHREKRRNIFFKEEEQAKNSSSRAKKREDQAYKEEEQSRNTSSRAKKREDPKYKDQEQSLDTSRRTKAREDPEYREQEQALDTSRRTKAREDPNIRARDNINLYVNRNSLEKLITSLEDEIKEAPTYTCMCDSGLYFKRSVKIVDKESIKKDSVYRFIMKYLRQTESPSQDGNYYLCQTCYEYALNEEIPSRCYNDKSGLRFPVVDQRILNLNELEIRLVSPRLAFQQIRSLGWDNQKGIRGNIVNVPIDIPKTITSLPRSFDEAETIQLNFKRRQTYNQNLIKENSISRTQIMKALEFLITTPLFNNIKPAIKVRSNWLNNFGPLDRCDFIVDDQDKSDEEEIEDDDYLNAQELIDEIDDDDRYVQMGNTMMNDRNHFPTIAPGENQAPIPICYDEMAEAATFLKIFGGELIKESKHVSLLNRCKSFFRNSDRRCAENIEYIFWMYKKLMAKKLLDSINTNLRRFKINERLTAQDILHNPELLRKYAIEQDLLKFMSDIRSSPMFWAKKRKEIFAMIRQLGIPEFFITFSPSERDWPELIVELEKLLNQNEMTIGEAQMLIAESYDKSRGNSARRLASKKRIIDLLCRDPVTVARYNENRFRLLISYMCHKNGPFRDDPIDDSYQRTEFQTRGSPHIHMIVWRKNAAPYKGNSNVRDCVKLIDKYITCKNYEQASDSDSSETSEDDISDKDDMNEKSNVALPKTNSRKKQDRESLKSLIKFQFHRHFKTGNCRMPLDAEDPDGEFICKKGFPFPILDESMVLLPLFEKKKGEQFTEEQLEEIDKGKTLYAQIRGHLNKIADDQVKRMTRGEKFRKNFTLNEYLARFNPPLAYDKYINAIRATLTYATVFYKRTSHDIMINPFNKDLIARHRANMDIQYVLNVHSLVSYITAYMMKSNAKISKLLQVAMDEIREKKNLSHREKLQSLANKWQNSSEISAQECIYHLLGMQLSHGTREVKFLLTFPIADRFAMVKPREMLEDMYSNDPNASNIYIEGIIDHYAKRPVQMEDICLAEFASWYKFFSNSLHDKMVNKKATSNQARKARERIEDENDDDDFDGVQQAEYLDSQEKINLEFFKLLDNIGWIQKRDRARIIRYRGYKRDNPNEVKQYYREQLLLFYPWRNEMDEIEDLADHKHVYSNNAAIIAKNKAAFENVNGGRSEDELERIANELDEQHEAEQALMARDFLNAEAILMADDDDLDDAQKEMREALEDTHGYMCDIEIGRPRATLLNDQEQRQFFNPKILKDPEFYKSISNLNKLQHQYLMTVMNLLRQGKTFCHLITGPGGAGKSYLIQAINQCVLRVMDEKYPRGFDQGARPDQQPCYVLLTSYLGKVAFRLRGSTLHSSFNLQIGRQADDENVEAMKRRFGVNNDTGQCALQLIIMDEVSLISHSMFNQIDRKMGIMLRKPHLAFGGIPTIVVGDFNQNKPICGGWIFKKTKDGYGSLTKVNTNVLWDNFKMFELKEIMRQKENKTFSEALTYFGNSGFVGLRSKYLNMLNSRIVQPEDVPREAIHLFFTNKDQTKFNDKKIGKAHYNLEARDRVFGGTASENKSNFNRYHSTLLSFKLEDCEQMPHVLKLKIGFRYMIIMNLDVSDGLANGTTGTLKNFIFNNDEQETVSKLYFDFYEEDVGAIRRKDNMVTPMDLQLAYDPSMSKSELESYTPITPQTANIFISHKYKWYFERIQFQIVPSEAMTISKIQGDTCGKVALDISQQFASMRSNYYVAMSRVTRLEDLYLYGRRSLLDGKHVGEGYNLNSKSLIESHSTEKLKIARDYFLEHNEVQAEMRRLRENCPVELAYSKILDSIDSEDFSIMFHNIDGCLFEKLDVIQHDYGMMQSSMLIFTHIFSPSNKQNINNDDYDIEGYIIMHLSQPNNNINYKHGYAIYVKIGQSVGKALHSISSMTKLHVFFEKFIIIDDTLFL